MAPLQTLPAVLAAATLLACGSPQSTVVTPETASAPSRGSQPSSMRSAPMTPAASARPAPGTSVERLDARLDALVAPDAALETIASGYTWAEGPHWVGEPETGYLIWSDVRENRAHKWSAAEGASVLVEPSGYTGAYFAGKEPGSNRLFLDAEGNLMLCQHGDRRIARMTAPLSDPRPEYETVVGFYDGKRLNSPNDVVYHSNGDLYFTDPPYGLPGGQAESSVKELDFQGVYRFRFRDSTLTLLTDEIARPNGIVFTPDEDYLIVANSQAEDPVWRRYPVLADGTLGEGEVWFDATGIPAPYEGIPDGMAMHSSGNLFTSGPGGILVLSPEAEHLGTIRTEQLTANCAFSPDERTLYITADSLIMRFPMAEAPTGAPAERQ